MGFSLNKVTLVGRVGKDAEVRNVGTEQEPLYVGQFPLATGGEKFKKKDGTEGEQKTEWHNIVVWRGLAKISGELAKKGAMVVIEGEIQYRSYKDKDGNERYATDILARDIIFTGKSAVEPKGDAQRAAENSFAPTASDAPNDLPF